MVNNGNLIIHFLNVGHGDCTIIEHPSGRITVIDINNGQQLDKDSYKEIKNVLTPSQGLMAAVGYLPEPHSVSQLLGLGLEEQYYYDVQDAKRMGYAVSLAASFLIGFVLSLFLAWGEWEIIAVFFVIAGLLTYRMYRFAVNYAHAIANGYLECKND